MDKILIQGLSAEATIGIHHWERQIKQPLRLDLVLFCNIEKAAVSDNINDAVDYFAVCADLRELIAQSSCGLIERLAEQCCQHLLKQYPITKVKLTLHKPEAVHQAQSVAVQITRAVD